MQSKGEVAGEDRDGLLELPSALKGAQPWFTQEFMERFREVWKTPPPPGYVRLLIDASIDYDAYLHLRSIHERASESLSKPDLDRG
jgi:hypothetical protein